MSCLKNAKCICGKLSSYSVSELGVTFPDTRLFHVIYDLSDFAHKKGLDAYLVGGFARDLISNGISNDADIEVFGVRDTDGLHSFLCQFIERHPYFKLDGTGKSFFVFKLTGDGLSIDVSLPRKENKISLGHKSFDVSVTSNLFEASLRRDFTINSIYIDLYKQKVYDFHNGVLDMQMRILRHVSDKFTEDALRVLRGMQFCGRFSMTASNETITLCQNHEKMYQDFSVLPSERIWGEWEKLFLKFTDFEKALDFLYAIRYINYFETLEDIKKDKSLVSLRMKILKKFWDKNMGHRVSKDDVIVLSLGMLGVHFDNIANFIKFMNAIGTPITLKKKSIFVTEQINKVSGQLMNSTRAEAHKSLCLFYHELSKHNIFPEMAQFLLQVILSTDEYISSDILDTSAVVVFEDIDYELLKPRWTGEMLKAYYTPGPVYRRILTDLYEAQLSGNIEAVEKKYGLLNKKV